jgi:hypothetical protein
MLSKRPGLLAKLKYTRGSFGSIYQSEALPGALPQVRIGFFPVAVILSLDAELATESPIWSLHGAGVRLRIHCTAVRQPVLVGVPNSSERTACTDSIFPIYDSFG